MAEDRNPRRRSRSCSRYRATQETREQSTTSTRGDRRRDRMTRSGVRLIPGVDPYARPSRPQQPYYPPRYRPARHGRERSRDRERRDREQGAIVTRALQPSYQFQPQQAPQQYVDSFHNYGMLQIQAAQSAPAKSPEDQQHIPVVWTNPAKRNPKQVYTLATAEGYRVPQAKGIPYMPDYPTEHSIQTVVSKRFGYEEWHLNRAGEDPLPLPNGLRPLPRRPEYADVEISGQLYGVQPRALREEVEARLERATDLYMLKLDADRSRNYLWRMTRYRQRQGLSQYYNYIKVQGQRLYSELSYNINDAIRRIRITLGRHRRHKEPNNILFEMRQATENLISDLEWYIAASDINRENMIYLRRMLNISDFG